MELLRSVCVLFLVLSVIMSHTYQGAVSMVMSVRRHRTSPQNAVAMVMRTRNETRLRLLLQSPASLFSLLAQPGSSGTQNRVLVRGSVTSQLWVAVDTDYDDNVYYVIDRKARAIKVVDQETSQVFNILTGISSKVRAVAVNWIDDAIYWTDAAYDAIFMYKAAGGCRHFECVSTVVGTDLDTPTGITVHPHLRLLFWTDVRGALGNLERSDLSGEDRTLLIEQLHRPSAVTIDYTAGRVYWLAQSGDISVVESCNLSGGDRYSAAVLADSRLGDVEVLNGLLLMTDPQKGELVMHDITTNVTRRLWSAGTPYGVCVYSQDKQRAEYRSQDTVLLEERNILDEGFLVLVSEQGSIFTLEKTAITATREVTAREVISRDSVTAIAADVANKFLYYYDRRHHAIEKVSLQFLTSNSSSASSVPTIVTRVAGNAAGLAVDWLSGTVYWTDNHYQRVAAVTNQSNHVRCLACRDVDQPRDIVVHPMKSLVFWTDVESGNPRIERINVTSMRRDVIISRHVRSLALAIDYKDDMLYWSEGPLLCRTDLEGRGSESCSSSPHYTPLAIKSLDIVHDFIVWTDFGEGVRVSDKEDNFDTLFTDSRVMVPGDFISDLLYFHPSRQPLYSNPCLLNNGDCAHFCIPTGERTSQCACATGYWTGRNGTCSSGFVEEDFVLVTDPLLGGIYQQFLYLPNYYVIPVRHAQRPADVAYDGTTGQLYWSDLGLGFVSRAYLNGTHQEIVFAHSDIVPEKLFLDVGQQLLFFIDTTRQKVGVVSLRTLTYKIIVQTFQFVFHDVVADARTGHIYLSASNSHERRTYVNDDVMFNAEGTILRRDVNASGLTEIVTTQGEPHGMVIDGEIMYWINAGSGTLNTVNLTNGNTAVIVHFPDWIKPDDITLLGQYLFWTDFEKPKMYRLHVSEGEEHVEERGDSVLFQLSAITSSESDDVTAGGESRDPCRHEGDTSSDCLSLLEEIEAVRQEKGICRVPEIQNGQVQTIHAHAYVTFNYVITVQCDPGHGEGETGRQKFTSVCKNGVWINEPQCVWAMPYTITASRQLGFYVVMTSSNHFVVPRGVTYLEVIAIGGGGGGMHACSTRFEGIARAGDGGTSRFGRYLRAGGGTGGTLHSGGRGGFGTVYFGGGGEISSRCLGGGAAGQSTWSRECRLGSTRCPFCGAGAAPAGCSLCQQRGGGCRGPWALPRQGIFADSFGGGATGWSGGGGGGGGGYSRRFVDVTPGEVIPVTVGRRGLPSVGQAGDGVVVVVWGGRMEDVLPPPDRRVMTCRPFTWTADISSTLGSDCSNGQHPRDP